MTLGNASVAPSAVDHHTATDSGSFLVGAIQGTDLTVSGAPAGPVAAGEEITLTVEFSKAMTAGQDYFGELLLGPPTAPPARRLVVRGRT